MKALCLLILFLYTVSSALGEEVSDDSTDDTVDTVLHDEVVLTLAQENFTEHVNDKKIILVEFYAPWCGHCKQLAPEYELAAKILQEHDIPLAKVDATANEELAQKYEIQGYPMMKVFRSGVAYDYDGPRKANGIVKYMQDQARPDWKPPPDRVVVLTNENFTETIESNPTVLVEFYAPWCGHCKRLAPEYTKAANLLHDKGVDVILAKVDATVEKELGTQFEVQGFPTMKVFHNGRPSEYTGPRQAQGIAEYMFKQSLPPTMPLRTANDIQSRLKFHIPMIVGFFESTEDADFLGFSAAANEGREAPVAWLHTTDSDIAKKFKIQFGTVAVFMPKQFYNKVEQKVKVYSGPFDIEAASLEKTLLKMATPLVGKRIESNRELMYSNYPVLVGYLSADDEEDSFGYWRDKLMLPLAVKYPDIQFVLSDEKEFAKEVESLQLHDRGDDLLIGILDKENKRYAYTDDDTSLDAIEEFIEAFKAGDLKPVKRSQAVPTKQTGPVKVVVGDNFKEIVEDPNKDVLIEFYAPWCGHCKALEPIYNSLAKKFKKQDKLVIAKIDATVNEFPDHYQVSGFPTLYFVPAGETVQPVLYEGDRTVKKIAKFLKKHATHSLNKGQRDEL